jgi:hypothetical protein
MGSTAHHRLFSEKRKRTPVEGQYLVNQCLSYIPNIQELGICGSHDDSWATERLPGEAPCFSNGAMRVSQRTSFKSSLILVKIPRLLAGGSD